MLNSEEDKDTNGNKLSTASLSQRIPQSVRASTQGSNNGGGGGGVSGLGLATRAGNETNKSGSNNMLLQVRILPLPIATSVTSPALLRFPARYDRFTSCK